MDQSENRFYREPDAVAPAIAQDVIIQPGALPPQLCAALIEFQKNCPSIPKTKTATIKPTFTYKYADIADVIDIIKKPMAEAGLGHMQPLETVGDSVFLVTRVFHSSGQHIESKVRVLSNGTPQEFGSRLTYLRRYVLCAMLGVAPDEDDDGAIASAPRVATLNDTRPDERVISKMGQDELSRWLAAVGECADVNDLKAKRDTAYAKCDEYGDTESRGVIRRAVNMRYHDLTGVKQ